MPSSNPQPRRPIDDKRRRVFLKVLAETGSVAAAARAATPHSKAKDGRAGRRSFEQLAERDPIFAAQVEEAKSHAIARVEEAIMERAFQPDERPIIDKEGNVVAVQTDRRNANAMLLRAAEALAPERWAPKKNISSDVRHSGQVAHAHLHAAVRPGVLEIDINDLHRLPAERADLLIEIIGELREATEVEETKRLEARDA
ncbi:MAG: hypothetical protein AAGB51_13965 [Planctomycetota bacterium]